MKGKWSMSECVRVASTKMMRPSRDNNVSDPLRRPIAIAPTINAALDLLVDLFRDSR